MFEREKQKIEFYLYKEEQQNIEHIPKDALIEQVKTIAEDVKRLHKFLPEIYEIQKQIYRHSINVKQEMVHILDNHDEKTEYEPNLELFKFNHSNAVIGVQEIQDALHKATSSTEWIVNETPVYDLQNYLDKVCEVFWNSNVDTTNLKLYDCIFKNPISKLKQIRFSIFTSNGHFLILPVEENSEINKNKIPYLVMEYSPFYLEHCIKKNLEK